MSRAKKKPTAKSNAERQKKYLQSRIAAGGKQIAVVLDAECAEILEAIKFRFNTTTSVVVHQALKNLKTTVAQALAGEESNPPNL